MVRNVLILCFILNTVFSFSQTEATISNSGSSKKLKGDFYLSWGYTRAWYSKSDLHFKDVSNKYHDATGRYNNYEFTIYDAKASDRPDFNQLTDVANITIPQFVCRVGYYFNNKKDFGIELNYDHTKYIVSDYQKVRVKGTFNGEYVDKDTILDPKSFLHFEHTDGANFMMVNFLKRHKLYEPSNKFNVGAVVKPGIGFVYPRTDVTMFGERLNNDWHVAGWIVGLEAGFRAEFLKYGMFEFMGKGAFANYTNALVLGKGNGKASHHFWAGQLTMSIGAMF